MYNIIENILKNKIDNQVTNMMFYKTITLKSHQIKEIINLNCSSNNNNNESIQKHVLKTFSNKKPTTKKVRKFKKRILRIYLT